jgi:hypothetical protein
MWHARGIYIVWQRSITENLWFELTPRPRFLGNAILDYAKRDLREKMSLLGTEKLSPSLGNTRKPSRSIL